MNRKNQHGAFLSASLLTLIATILLSCNEQNKQGAVVFSFDDQYIDEWYSQRDLFNQYNIKATFFISRPHQLKSDQIAIKILFEYLKSYFRRLKNSNI